MNYGIVLAGGSGTRMGLAIPKQYAEIGGKPVIVHTLEVFVNSPWIDHVVVPCPEEWIPYTKELCMKYFSENRVEVIAGGRDRNGSIMNAIQYLENHLPFDETSIIVTHDGVRPFLTGKMIEDNIACVKEFRACGTAVPSTDTILAVEGEEIVNIPNRAGLYNAQTPQSFYGLEFKETVLSLSEEERSLLTDATKVYIFKGKKVRVVAGDVSNIKLTYQHDMIMAEAILKNRMTESEKSKVVV